MAIRTVVTRGYGNGTFNGTIADVVLRGYAAAADVTAPTLSAPTATRTSDTTASGTVTTDEGNGTLYWVVTTSGTAPSVAQIQAGQDNSGVAAADSGNQSVTATGVQSISSTGLSAGQTYYIYYQQQDAATNDSTVVTSSSFSTSITVPTGGFMWDAFEREQKKWARIKKERQKREEEAKKLKDRIDQELALELQAEEKERERIQELRSLARIAKQHEQELKQEMSDRVIRAAERAFKQGNYSAMEALEREIRKAREEEEFLAQAMRLLM